MGGRGPRRNVAWESKMYFSAEREREREREQPCYDSKASIRRNGLSCTMVMNVRCFGRRDKRLRQDWIDGTTKSACVTGRLSCDSTAELDDCGGVTVDGTSGEASIVPAAYSNGGRNQHRRFLVRTNHQSQSK
jgi:hypothetical protein